MRVVRGGFSTREDGWALRVTPGEKLENKGCLGRVQEMGAFLRDRAPSTGLAPAWASPPVWAVFVTLSAVVFHWGVCVRLVIFQKVRQKY